MYRAVTGRIRRRPSFVRTVNATNNGLPALVFPTAIKRSSSAECFGSGATRGPCTNRASISAIDTPCFWHLDRLPSSQSNPPTCKFIVAQNYTNVYTKPPLTWRNSNVLAPDFHVKYLFFNNIQEKPSLKTAASPILSLLILKYFKASPYSSKTWRELPLSLLFSTTIAGGTFARIVSHTSKTPQLTSILEFILCALCESFAHFAFRLCPQSNRKVRKANRESKF